MFSKRHDFDLKLNVVLDDELIAGVAAVEQSSLQEARARLVRGIAKQAENDARLTFAVFGHQVTDFVAHPEVEYPRLQVSFRGRKSKITDPATYWTWQVTQLEGVTVVARARLVGSDGTDLEHWDSTTRKKLEAAQASLPAELLAELNALPEEVVEALVERTAARLRAEADARRETLSSKGNG